MKFLPAGLDLISRFEGCRLTAYQDKGGVWTIGWGETENVREGDVVTQDWADEKRAARIAQKEAAVRRLVPPNLSDHQFTALVCFVYNVGEGAFAQSFLRHCIKCGHPDDAAQQFEKWDHVKHQEDPQLLERRLAERDLFLTPDSS